jgi:hypothetical protein
MAGISHAVIPQPLHHKPLDGCLSYHGTTPPRILHQEAAESAAAFLQAELQRLFAAPEPPSVGILVDQRPDPLGVQLRVDPALAQVQHLRCKEEAYHLIATPQGGVTIVAAAPAGAFYGAVTLLQLLRKQGQQVELAAVEVSSCAAWRQHSQTPHTLPDTTAAALIMLCLAPPGAGRAHVPLAWRAAGCGAPLLPPGLHQASPGLHGRLQAQPLPLAPHRGPGGRLGGRGVDGWGGLEAGQTCRGPGQGCGQGGATAAGEWAWTGVQPKGGWGTAAGKCSTETLARRAIGEGQEAQQLQPASQW